MMSKGMVRRGKSLSPWFDRAKPKPPLMVRTCPPPRPVMSRQISEPSWWVGVPREAWAATAAAQLPRLLVTRDGLSRPRSS